MYIYKSAALGYIHIIFEYILLLSSFLYISKLTVFKAEYLLNISHHMLEELANEYSV